MGTTDLYALLKADRSASDAELKWAYERELKMAHKMDAFKHAQEIDAAYAILRDPQRRAMYDAHGITDPAVRDSPLTRTAAPGPTSSYQSWSAIGDPGAGRARSASGHGKRAKIYAGVAVLAVAIGLGAWLESDFSSAKSGGVIAPHTRSGRIEMVCPGNSASQIETVVVKSGARVKCANGTTPTFHRLAADRQRRH